MTCRIDAKLSDTKQKYWILKVYQEWSDLIPKYVHTSKDLAYLKRLVKERYSK